uniref:Uncharacterized protein n=1 Tax=Physcomitrium patens TaxID=3218 RepID=A0A2K1J0S1_PHYPA|nr:hypothetical protein PHYPA_023025 [Physcomitrium patens]
MYVCMYVMQRGGELCKAGGWYQGLEGRGYFKSVEEGRALRLNLNWTSSSSSVSQSVRPSTRPASVFGFGFVVGLDYCCCTLDATRQLSSSHAIGIHLTRLALIGGGGGGRHD